jgi:hypothetical protein
MSMLLFMPWCPIDQPYDLGPFKLVPFEPGTALGDVEKESNRVLDKLVSTYRTIEGDPVQSLAVIHSNDRSPTDDLSNEEIAVAYDLLTLATFSGLAARDFLDPIAAYCNADCFAMYVQQFENADFTALTTRKRAGDQVAVWAVDRISTTVPLHCHDIKRISLDQSILSGLLAYRDDANASEWGRWQSAISCFNQATIRSTVVDFRKFGCLPTSASNRVVESLYSRAWE